MLSSLMSDDLPSFIATIKLLLRRTLVQLVILFGFIGVKFSGKTSVELKMYCLAKASP
jgi:hypothetical protein